MEFDLIAMFLPIHKIQALSKFLAYIHKKNWNQKFGKKKYLESFFFFKYLSNLTILNRITMLRFSLVYKSWYAV